MTPEQVIRVIDWKGNLWRSALGTLDADQFAHRMEAEAAGGGPAWEARRWHAGDGDLIYSGDRSWAFTNQWGHRTSEAMELLLDRWPDSAIEVVESLDSRA